MCETQVTSIRFAILWRSMCCNAPFQIKYNISLRWCQRYFEDQCRSLFFYGEITQCGSYIQIQSHHLLSLDKSHIFLQLETTATTTGVKQEIFQGREGLVALGIFAKHFLKNFWRFFSQIFLKLHFEQKIQSEDGHNLGSFFRNQCTFSDFQKRAGETSQTNSICRLKMYNM